MGPERVRENLLSPGYLVLGGQQPMDLRRSSLPLLLLGFVALLLGVWSGWVRIGWRWPSPTPSFDAVHGPLMVAGFLGTLIGLERAVGLRARWGLAAPAATAAGALLLVALGPSSLLGPALIAGGSFVLTLLFLAILRKRPEAATALMALGALAWLLANLLWLVATPPLAVYPVFLGWVAFPVLVIVGERLELSRIRNLSPGSVRSLAAAAALFLLGAAAPLLSLPGGAFLAGWGLVLVALWLLRYDVLWFEVRREGLPRFLGTALFLGYLWLAIAGLLLVAASADLLVFSYDAVVHAIFLGFVLSMVFAHAPIVFPGLLGRPMPFTWAFYLPLLVLHASLALRILADFAGNASVRAWGGLMNGIALFLFLATAGASLRRGP